MPYLFYPSHTKIGTITLSDISDIKELILVFAIKTK